jgi:hypothetical protein
MRWNMRYREGVINLIHVYHDNKTRADVSCRRGLFVPILKGYTYSLIGTKCVRVNGSILSH